jgi:hypothetical protein
VVKQKFTHDATMAACVISDFIPRHRSSCYSTYNRPKKQQQRRRRNRQQPQQHQQQLRNASPQACLKYFCTATRYNSEENLQKQFQKAYSESPLDAIVIAFHKRRVKGDKLPLFIAFYLKD